MQQRETKEQASNLKSAFNADRKQLQEKIDDLERKLTNRMVEIQTLEKKIHMMGQSEAS